RQEKSLAKSFIKIDSTNWEEKIQKSNTDQWFIYFTDKDIGLPVPENEVNVSSVASLINAGFQVSVMRNPLERWNAGVNMGLRGAPVVSIDYFEFAISCLCALSHSDRASPHREAGKFQQG